MFKYIPLLTACCLASCMVGPDFQRPANDLPASWAAAKPPHSTDQDLRSWWRIFGDPQLNRLVSTSLNNNPDMKVALLRIREARERLRISQASLLPSADASAGWSLSRTGASAAPPLRILPWERPPPGNWTSSVATGVPLRRTAPP